MKEPISAIAASPLKVALPHTFDRFGARTISSTRMKPKILIVDDEPDVVQLIEYNLKAAGYDAITAAGGSEALDQARSSSPNLIILDLMLREMDGLDVCKMLRRDKNTAGIPIVMLTAKASESDRVLGLELGADDYVTKPFSPRELVLRVKRLLRAETLVDDNEVIQVGDLSVDIPRHEAR